jgi:hypothetical protein
VDAQGAIADAKRAVPAVGPAARAEGLVKSRSVSAPVDMLPVMSMLHMLSYCLMLLVMHLRVRLVGSF